MSEAATKAYLACMLRNWPESLSLLSGRGPLLIDIPPTGMRARIRKGPQR